MKSSDMRVFPIHVIREDNELDHVRIDGLAETRGNRLAGEERDQAHAPTIAILVGFGADVKRDPTVRLVKSKDAHILQVGRTSSCPNSDGRRSVRVIGWERKEHAQFLGDMISTRPDETMLASYLYCNFPWELDGYEVRLRAI